MIETKIIPRVFLAELFGLGNRLLLNTSGGGLPDGQQQYNSAGAGYADNSPTVEDTGYRAFSTRLKERNNRWGLPMFTSLTLSVGDPKPGNKLMLEMPDAIIEVSRPKNIVRTQVAGKDGTVKEIVSWDDYKIKVRAVLTYGRNYIVTVDKKDFSAERWYPNELVNTFIDICNHHGSVHFAEPYLSTPPIGLTKVVIESFNLVNTPQVTNLQVIEFDCVSDNEKLLDLARR